MAEQVSKKTRAKFLLGPEVAITAHSTTSGLCRLIEQIIEELYFCRQVRKSDHGSETDLLALLQSVKTIIRSYGNDKVHRQKIDLLTLILEREIGVLPNKRSEDAISFLSRFIVELGGTIPLEPKYICCGGEMIRWGIGRCQAEPQLCLPFK